MSVPAKTGCHQHQTAAKLFLPISTVFYFYPVCCGLVMSDVSHVAGLLVRRMENPEGLGRVIDLADPLNLLRIHLVVFFDYCNND